MDKTFLAINLDQFHEGQKNKMKIHFEDHAWTEAQIRFIGAKNIQAARDFVKEFYPATAWVVIPKTYFDKNIVCKSN